MSRRFNYTEELAQTICDLLAEGKSLVQICELDGMPHRATVLRWMGSDPAFASRIARVREGGQADFLFDEMAQIEAGVLAGKIPADVARAALSSKQWRAAKLAPKKYGDKTSVESTTTVKVEHTRKLDISTLSDDQLDALEGALRATIAQFEVPKVIENDIE
jgi:hypothetical protein